MPQGSLLSKPLVEDGVVYIAAREFLFALKEESGERIWEQAIPDTLLYNPYLANGILYAESPAIRNMRWTRTKFGNELPHIVALNARTGQLLWIVGPSYSRAQGYNNLSLPIVGGLLLVNYWECEKIESTGEPDAPVKYQGTGTKSIVGLDAQTGRVALSYPLQDAAWGEQLDGILYLVESVDLPQEPGVFTAKRAFTLKSFRPGTDQLLSAHPLLTEQNTFYVDGTGNGLLYHRIAVPTTGPYPSREYRFVAYHLSDGSVAWSYAMPPLPPRVNDQVEPGSAPVLAP
jgi:outer membrane protein assembly factor BamB